MVNNLKITTWHHPFLNIKTNYYHKLANKLNNVKKKKKLKKVVIADIFRTEIWINKKNINKYFGCFLSRSQTEDMLWKQNSLLP